MQSLENFMAQMEKSINGGNQTTAANRFSAAREKDRRIIEKISLNFQGNFGRYQIFPFNSPILDFPYVTLYKTREICIPRKAKLEDGTESEYMAWIKILPKEAFQFKDSTGRVTSSLTQEDEEILSQVYTVYDQLYEELGGRDKALDIRNLIRKRNYTIFNAYCLNFWDFSTEGNRAPRRQNFPGLFVTTARGFTDAINENISTSSLMMGGDMSGIYNSVYTDALSGRDGYLIFSISRSKTSSGYALSAQHEIGKAPYLQGITISQDDAELLKQNPVESFLGWQASKQDIELPVESRRLFNAPLMKETAEYMKNQLASIRMRKEQGMSLEEVIKITNDMALNGNKGEEAPITNDPMLKGNGVADNGFNAANLSKNTEPFSTPPVSHTNPVTGMPENNGNQFGGGFGTNNNNSSSPFSNPFGGSGFGAPNTEGDLPF